SLDWRKRDKFKAYVAEGLIDDQKVMLLKPATMYNLTGDAVQAAAQFYKITPADIVVAHDELALQFGVIRARVGGSDAGNNGIKSVIAAIGQDFARIRVGIANEHLATTEAADFVLSRFNKGEQQTLSDIKKHATIYVGAFISGSFDHTTHTM
ncbi:MAG TPA: aminoacyl-tRNA hydrolase, partial [Magnetospirillaceae bacterium]|nr:aminoacyl-tRNA hydrolase [Magnetospirillaceae bacterium]